MARIKKQHLAVLAVAGAGLFGTASHAQLQNMLLQGIQAPTAGINVGTDEMARGTIQYTNSAGSSDGFSVGTNTSISSNSSASSTADYAVTTDANFMMGNNSNCTDCGTGLTTVNQTIGTSGSTASDSSSMDLQLAAGARAEASAESEVSQSYKTSHGGEDGYWYWGGGSWESTTEQEWTDKRSASYEAAYEAEFSASFSDMSEAATGQSGTISGSFVKNAGSTTSTVSDSYSYEAADGTAVAGAVTYDENGAAAFAAEGDIDVVTSNLQRTTTFVQDEDSSNDVTVNGIGADNTVIASDNANFTTEIGRTTDFAYGSDVEAGTASGSAGGGVNTAASANASSSTFVNSFVTAY